PLPKRGSEPSFRLAIVRCSAGKNGSHRVRRIGWVWEGLGRSWRGTRGVPRTILTAHRRFAGIWGVLGIFGDICSKWHGGWPPLRGARSKLTRSEVQGSIQDPRSNMNEGFGQMGGLAGLADSLESGASHRSPRRWRADGSPIASSHGGLARRAAPGPLETAALHRELESPVEGKLGGEFPIRLETRNGGLWLGSSGLGKCVPGNSRYFLIKNRI